MALQKKWFPYVLFVLILTVCFLYYLFPSEKIKNYMIFHLNKSYPYLNISIDRIKPTFPPGLKLYKVNVYQMNDALLTLDQMKIVPKLWSLFRSNIIFFFNIDTCDGTIHGKGALTFDNSFSRMNVEATLSDIQIGKIHAIQGLKSRNISGVLEGHLTYSNDKASGEDVKTTIVIADGTIKLLSPILTLQAVNFDTIESDVVVKNREVQLKQCTLKGRQLDGSMAGSIILEKPLERSLLKLAGTIKPHPALLDDLGKDQSQNLIPKKFFSNNGLSIKLYGTIEKPSFSIN